MLECHVTRAFRLVDPFVGGRRRIRGEGIYSSICFPNLDGNLVRNASSQSVRLRERYERGRPQAASGHRFTHKIAPPRGIKQLGVAISPRTGQYGAQHHRVVTVPRGGKDVGSPSSSGKRRGMIQPSPERNIREYDEAAGGVSGLQDSVGRVTSRERKQPWWKALKPR